jgi:hypothetical protein
MQRLRIAFCFAAVIGAAIFALAVESPFAGTWKLNLSKIHHFNTAGHKSRVPHISLVFREIWDSARSVLQPVGSRCA